MSKRILIIEDEMALVHAIQDKLELLGYNTLKASDGLEGLDMALKEHPDLILLDLMMPQMNGLEMLEKLRQDAWGAQAPVIILTNLNQEDQIKKATELGAPDYYVKTATPLSMLLDIVKTKI